jgi:hypothetical protein
VDQTSATLETYPREAQVLLEVERRDPLADRPDLATRPSHPLQEPLL